MILGEVSYPQAPEISVCSYSSFSRSKRITKSHGSAKKLNLHIEWPPWQLSSCQASRQQNVLATEHPKKKQKFGPARFIEHYLKTDLRSLLGGFMPDFSATPWRRIFFSQIRVFFLFSSIIMYYHVFEGSLEVKLPTIWTDEKQSREEAERRGRLEERRVEEKE